MFASTLPRLASALMQPAVLAAGVATGVGMGALGVATGAIPVKDPGPPRTSLYECPASARIVTSVATNQNVLVTAKSADGAWLQIYVGEPGADRGWARATSLKLRAAPDTLPIADCTPAASQLPGGSQVPGSPGAGGESANPSPTRPNAGGPTLTNLSVGYPGVDPQSGTHVIGRPSRPCNGETEAFIDVTVTDPDGVASVTLSFTPTHGQTISVPMQHPVGAPANSTDWYGGIEAQDGWAFGVIAYSVEATDSNGVTSGASWKSDQWLELRAC